jgi:hypothetical protein
LRFLISSIVCLIAAYGISGWLTVPENPEVAFWREAIVGRDRDIAAARTAHPDQPFLFFTGGSSTAFSIDPAIVEPACGLLAFNLALPISASAPYILHQAFKRTRPGDILVIGVEADILSFSGEFKPSSLAFALGLMEQDPAGIAGGQTFDKRLALRDAFNLPRPGPGYLVTLAGRLAYGKGYRYKSEDIRYHGRIETPVKDQGLEPLDAMTPRHLHPEAAEWLQKLAVAAKEKDVTLFYAMPWRLTKPQAETACRAANRSLLDEINPIIPVLEDGADGVSTRTDFFSDSLQHLTAEGSSVRTRALVPILKTKVDAIMHTKFLSH